MATENKAVTIYLPKELEESLIEYCTNHGLTRKGKSGNEKPSLGSGAIEALKDYFSVVSDESTQSHFSEQIEEKVMERVREIVSDLDKRLVELQLKVVDQPSSNASDPGEVSDPEVSDFTSDLVSDSLEPTSQEDIGKQDGFVQSPLIEMLKESDVEIKLTGKQIADRFGVKPPKISSEVGKGEDSFSEFSKTKDPDGVTWLPVRKVRGKGYYYCPSGGTESNVLSKLRVWFKDLIDNKY
ncbi:MAG: hypothetical protein F6K24_52575 [Okeania sp. SIO2D1]|nr:hypothetical protein [Okeania sp. SIO2D1]